MSSPPTSPLGAISRYLTTHSEFPILVLCHDRPNDLATTLDALLLYIPTARENILVLQDGSDAGVKTVVAKRSLKHKTRTTPYELQGGQQIAQHYGWSIQQGFAHFPDAPAVIVLEDDLTPSPDFMEWFVNTAPILERDETLWCVSAWNDNGFRGLVKDPYGVRRTLFFPGLGWLLTRKV